MIKFEQSKLNKIDQYLKLYSRIFRFKKKKSYFEWLYIENPSGKFIGIDCYDDEELIGQVGGIPAEFKYFGENSKFLISINVCVDPKYQGQKLFSKMASRFEKLAKEKNFDGIIAIANKAATPAWIKSIGLNFLKQLDVYIGFGKVNNKETNKHDYDFYSIWNNEKLNWRIKNPFNKTYIVNHQNKKMSIYAKTKYPFIDVYSPVIFSENKISINENYRNFLRPIIFLGIIKNLDKKLLVSLPETIKPSPLNFLYKFINKEKILNPDKVYFTFLDFDAF